MAEAELRGDWQEFQNFFLLVPSISPYLSQESNPSNWDLSDWFPVGWTEEKNK